MGRNRIHKDRLMKPTDYHYDFPENRIIAKRISREDKKTIQKISGYTEWTFHHILQGHRRMKPFLKDIILEAIRLNEEKHQKLESYEVNR